MARCISVRLVEDGWFSDDPVDRRDRHSSASPGSLSGEGAISSPHDLLFDRSARSPTVSTR